MYTQILSKNCNGNVVSLEEGSAGRLLSVFPEVDQDFYLDEILGFLAEILPELTMRNATLFFIEEKEQKLIFLLREVGVSDQTLVMSGPKMPFGALRDEWENMNHRGRWFFEGYEYFGEAYVMPHVAVGDLS